MRVLVTGSRSWPWREAVEYELEALYCHEQMQMTSPRPVTLTIVHGWCPNGVDAFADAWARAKVDVLTERHPADWGAHGRSAGPLRNQLMVDRGADLCLAFIHNQSKGATHCAWAAEKHGIETRRFELVTR